MSEGRILITLGQQAKERAIGALREYQQTIWDERGGEKRLEQTENIIKEIKENLS